MNPEVRALIISQLLVIILPVGTLIALWLWLLKTGTKRQQQPPNL